MENTSTLQCFSQDGSIMVLCNDNNVLKFWNTNVNILEHEFQPAEYLSSAVTCLSFCKERESAKNTNVLSIGTKQGLILIYDYNKREVASKLVHSEKKMIKSLSWRSTYRLVSLGEDKLILWNTKLNQIVYALDITNQNTVCATGLNEYVLAQNAITLLTYKFKKKEVVQTKLNEQNKAIHQLCPIYNNDEVSYILSLAKSDRFLYAWSTNREIKEAVEIFKVGDSVQGFSAVSMADSTIGIAAWTRKGQLKYFVQHLNGSKNNNNKRRMVDSKGCLTFVSNSNESHSLQIFGASFLSNSSLLVAYGNRAFPLFEVIKLEELKGLLRLARKDPECFDKKKTAIVNAVTPDVPEGASYFMPSQFSAGNEICGKFERKRKKSKFDESSLPLEERLDSLAITHTTSGLPKGTPLDNCALRLVQALKSEDSGLLNSVLLKGEEDVEVINSTVRKLPVKNVVPFLKCLIKVIAGKGLKNVSMVNWIKAVFEHHMSLLSSMPNKEELMQPFYAICNSRVTTLPTVCGLHSRVNLLLTHAKNRQSSLNDDTQHLELHAYKDYDSSDDENDDDLAIGMSGLPSESEDTWDYLSEEEMEEDDDVEMISNGYSEDKTKKRPLDEVTSSDEG